MMIAMLGMHVSRAYVHRHKLSANRTRIARLACSVTLVFVTRFLVGVRQQLTVKMDTSAICLHINASSPPPVVLPMQIALRV